MHEDAARPDRRLELIALLAFASLTAWLNLRHEPWHDELQAWRIALDSRSLADLIANLRYEGHPPLFHLLLRAVGGLTPSWSPVVVLHWLVACTSAWIVLWLAPFTKVQRVLVVFGYFFVYEYAVIVRPYGLGTCLALGACAAWSGVPRRPRLTALSLTLLATTSAMGLVLAIPLSIGFLADAAISTSRSWWADGRRRRRVIVASVLLGTAAITIVGLVVPPPDALFQISLDPFAGDRRWKIGNALAVPAHVLLPLAEHFPDGATQWSSWAFAPVERRGMLVAGLVSLVVLALMTAIVARRRAALVLWLVSSGCLIGFFAFVFVGGPRHHGYLVVAFLCAAWLAFAPAHGALRHSRSSHEGAVDGWRQTGVTTLLAVMVVPSIQFAIAETREPFSDAGYVARLLETDSLATAPIVGLAFPWAQPVAALLGRPVFYPAESRQAMWVARRSVVEGPQEMALADSAVRALLSTHCHVVVLSSRAKPNQQFVWDGARELPMQAGTPMSGDPLRAWVVTAPRCGTMPDAMD